MLENACEPPRQPWKQIAHYVSPYPQATPRKNLSRYANRRTPPLHASRKLRLKQISIAQNNYETYQHSTIHMSTNRNLICISRSTLA